MTSLPGFKELIVGDSGTGKTHSIRSLIGTGIQPILLATEPGFRSLAPCDNPACSICGPIGSANRAAPPIPYYYIAPGTGSVDLLVEQAKDIATKNQSQLASTMDTKRLENFGQWIKMMEWLNKPVDMNGKTYPPVFQWGNDMALVVDSWSGLGDMAMDLFAGKRALLDKPDYQIAQSLLRKLAKLLTMQLSCHVIVLAHIARGEDALEGKNRITLDTVGNKLAPTLPRLFDDMIYAEREGTTFTWSTALTGAVAKGRNVPIKAGLKPDFSQVVASWKKAGGVIPLNSDNTPPSK